MRILRLTVDNVKRIKAVDIAPDGTLQVISGRNAQGKSSIMDAIWGALNWRVASRSIPSPIRDGEDEAKVFVDLGDIRVTRTWRRGHGSTLTLTNVDGSRQSKPQELLDEFVGQLSFDPLAFTRLKPVEQRQALLDLVGLDFRAADIKRQKLYDDRLETGQAARSYGDLPRLAKDAPLRERSSGPIMDRLRTAQQTQRDNDDVRNAASRAQLLVDQLDAQIADLQARRQTAAIECGRLTGLVEALADPESLDQLQTELSDLEDYNRQVRANRKLAEDIDVQKALRHKYAALTDQIEQIDHEKARAVAAATMPVEGLGFDGEGVTYQGVPFSQASSAEQITVSMGMAMAMNPEIRVVRILDGSLLDDESMAAIAQMAAAHDFQVWIERVGDDSPSAVVIEDGMVQSAGLRCFCCGDDPVDREEFDRFAAEPNPRWRVCTACEMAGQVTA